MGGRCPHPFEKRGVSWVKKGVVQQFFPGALPPDPRALCAYGAKSFPFRAFGAEHDQSFSASFAPGAADSVWCLTIIIPPTIFTQDADGIAIPHLLLITFSTLSFPWHPSVWQCPTFCIKHTRVFMLMMRKWSEDPSLTVPLRDGLSKRSFFAEVVLSPSCIVADDAKFGLGLPLGVSVSSTSSLLVGDSHFSLCWFPLTLYPAQLQICNK